MKKRRGGAAVLLMLMLSSVLAISAVLFNGACSAASKSMSEGCLDLAGRSALSQYHRGLQKDYGLFALKADDEVIASDLKYYAGVSFPAENVRGSGSKQEILRLCRIQLQDVSADSGEYSMLVPEMTELQVLSYMKYRALILGAEQLLNGEAGLRQALSEGASACDLETARRKAAEEAEQRQAEEDADKEEEGDEEKEAREKREQAVRNLKARIKEMKAEKSGSAPGESSHRLLKNSREKSLLPSHLSDCGGFPDFSALSSGSAAQFLTEARNSLYINEYISEHFSNSMTENALERGGFFHNEIEYILWGAESDQINFKRTRALLFTMRCSMNLAHIYSDEEKRNMTLEAAAVIAPGPAAAAVQFLIATLWAGAESVNDLKILYSGGRVPFMKNSEDWKLGLEGILSEESVPSQTGGEKGQAYIDYLKFFLALQSRQSRILRMLDVVQLNVRLRWDRTFFVKDYCTGFAAEAVFARKQGMLFPFRLTGGYVIEKVQSY